MDSFLTERMQKKPPVKIPADWNAPDTSGMKVLEKPDVAIDSTVVHKAGTETVTGAKTFDITITGAISGNAGSVTNGVYVVGTQSIGGVKTFTSATGFNTTAPSKQVEINSVDGNNLRLTYNDDNGSPAKYADLLTNFAGDLNITCTSGNISFDNENISTSGTITSGSRVGHITNAVDTYQILVTDDTIVCNKSTAFTVTLPIAVIGQEFEINNIGAGAVTVEGISSDTIDSELNQIVYQHETMHVRCIANNTWSVI